MKSDLDKKAIEKLVETLEESKEVLQRINSQNSIRIVKKLNLFILALKHPVKPIKK